MFSSYKRLCKVTERILTLRRVCVKLLLVYVKRGRLTRPLLRSAPSLRKREEGYFFSVLKIPPLCVAERGQGAEPGICGTRLLHQMPQRMDDGMHMLGGGMNQVE